MDLEGLSQRETTSVFAETGQNAQCANDKAQDKRESVAELHYGYCNGPAIGTENY